MMFEFKPTPKPKFKRRTPKRGNKTRITQKVRKEVMKRSNGLCERCGKHSAWGMEMAHLEGAGQLGSGSDPWNIALLCGPQVESGTCHNFADTTRAGREWRKEKRIELEQYYKGELE